MEKEKTNERIKKEGRVRFTEKKVTKGARNQGRKQVVKEGIKKVNINERKR